MDVEHRQQWSQAFDTFFEPFGGYFVRSESRATAHSYVRGLLADIPRKNSWQLAEALGLLDPHPLQRLLYEVPWDADAVCAELRQQVIARLGYEPGIGVIDGSGFVKKGDKSVGVGRQYCGRVGKVENCQVGVFLGYATPLGAAFIDRELYIPQDWFADRERCRAAKIPDEVVFQTKPQIAQRLLERAWAEDLPLQWVVGDTVYGNSPSLRHALHVAGRYYVLGIGSQHSVQLSDGSLCLLSDLIARQSEVEWERLCFQVGEKGPIWYEWRAWRNQLPNESIGEQWLVLRRDPQTQTNYHCFVSNAPADTDLTELAGVALTRHAIEQLLEEAKSETGLADYEVRHWHGWYRHITLSLLAHTFLKWIQHEERQKKSLAHLVEPQCG